MKLIQLLQFRNDIEGSDFFLTRVTCRHLLSQLQLTCSLFILIEERAWHPAWNWFWASAGIASPLPSFIFP